MSRTLILVLCSVLAVSVPAHAETFPNKPIKIIVPFGPGSGSDIVARNLARYLQARWQQPVVVDNRAGANGVIGTEALRSAPPDGYTLGISTNSTHAAAPYLVRKLSYDPLRDFEHVALIGVGGAVGIVPAASPFKSIPALVKYAQAHSGEVFFGYADTIALAPAALLKARANLPIEGVAYKTSAAVLTDLLGGRIQFAFFNYMTGAAQVASGRFVPIAISEAKRNAFWPGIPTVAESYPGFEVRFFVGVSAPRGVPAEILRKLDAALRDARLDAGFSAPLEKIGLTFAEKTPAQFRAFLIEEGARWRELIKTAKMAEP